MNKIAREVEGVGKEFVLVKVKTSWFDYFDNPDKKWVVIRIKPNQKLESLRYKLYQVLCKMASPQTWDQDPSYKFHISIGKTTKGNVYTKLRHRVNRWTCPEMEQFLLRISIINGEGKIFKEYDLIQGRLLTRQEALSRREKQKTLQGLRMLLNKAEPRPRHASITSSIKGFFKRLFV